MSQAEGKYYLWYYSDGGYQYKPFDRLEELPDLITECYTTDYFIMKSVELKIGEIRPKDACVKCGYEDISVFPFRLAEKIKGEITIPYSCDKCGYEGILII